MGDLDELADCVEPSFWEDENAMPGDELCGQCLGTLQSDSKLKLLVDNKHSVLYLIFNV